MLLFFVGARGEYVPLKMVLPPTSILGGSFSLIDPGDKAYLNTYTIVTMEIVM